MMFFEHHCQAKEVRCGVCISKVDQPPAKGGSCLRRTHHPHPPLPLIFMTFDSAMQKEGVARQHSTTQARKKKLNYPEAIFHELQYIYKLSVCVQFPLQRTHMPPPPLPPWKSCLPVMEGGSTSRKVVGLGLQTPQLRLGLLDSLRICSNIHSFHIYMCTA